MSSRSGSGRSSCTRPISDTCLYQLPLSRIVSATRGSARMWPSRLRLASMFRKTVPSSVHSYHVAAVCSSPSGRIVATTHGFAFLRNSCSSDGGNPFGIGGGAYVTPFDRADVFDQQRRQRADENEHAHAEERRPIPCGARDQRHDEV